MRSLLRKYHDIHVIVSFLVLLCIPKYLFPQADTLSTVDKVSMQMRQHNYDIVIDFAEQTYNKVFKIPENLSEEDVAIIRLGLSASISQLNIPSELGYTSIKIKAKNFAQLIKPYVCEKITELIAEYPNYENMKDSAKMHYLISFYLEFEKIFPIIFFSDKTTLKQYIQLYHEIIGSNCEVFLKGDFEQKKLMCQLVSGDALWVIENSDEAITTFMYYFDILKKLGKESQKHKQSEQFYIAWWIYQAMLCYKSFVDYLIVATIKTHDTTYNTLIANYYLTLNELKFFSKGYYEAHKYYETDWEEIQKALNGKSIALQMFDLGIARGFIEITKGGETPTFSIYDITTGGVLDKRAFLPYLKKYDNIYYSPLNNMYNLDIVSNDKIYQKFNLYDITRKRGFSKYSHSEDHWKYRDDTILMLADIDYGYGNLIPILKESPKVIRSLKKSYKKKLKVISGNNVKKNVLDTIGEDVGILHISTHGIIDQYTNINIEQAGRNKQEMDSLILEQDLGIRDLKTIKLCLSGYNENPQMNSISASDILFRTDEFYGMVYLDACNMAKQANNFPFSSSMAEVFYIKGATSIIAYINPINEIVAADFAQLFYKKLRTEKGVLGGRDKWYKSYHDVFYKTKNEILQKYKTSELLRRDMFNNPILDIVLWE